MQKQSKSGNPFGGKYRGARVLAWQAQNNTVKSRRKKKKLRKIANASRRYNRGS